MISKKKSIIERFNESPTEDPNFVLETLKLIGLTI